MWAKRTIKVFLLLWINVHTSCFKNRSNIKNCPLSLELKRGRTLVCLVSFSVFSTQCDLRTDLHAADTVGGPLVRDANELTHTGTSHRANRQTWDLTELIKKQLVFSWVGVWFWYFSSSLGNVFMCKTSSVNHTVVPCYVLTPLPLSAIKQHEFIVKLSFGFANLTGKMH